MDTVCGTYNGNGGGSEPAMSYYKVVYENGVIKHNGQTLTYAQLVDKYNDNKYFLYAEANGLTMIPALPPMESDPILEFSCSWIYDGKATISRLIINSNNQVKYENKYLIEDVSNIIDITQSENKYSVKGSWKKIGNLCSVSFVLMVNEAYSTTYATIVGGLPSMRGVLGDSRFQFKDLSDTLSLQITPAGTIQNRTALNTGSYICHISYYC